MRHWEKLRKTEDRLLNELSRTVRDSLNMFGAEGKDTVEKPVVQLFLGRNSKIVGSYTSHICFKPLTNW